MNSSVVSQALKNSNNTIINNSLSNGEASSVSDLQKNSPKKFISAKHLQKIARSSSAHKGQNGRVVVVGGSQDYVGAVALAAQAALRSGVDLVVVCAPEKVAWAINRSSFDLITTKLPGEELRSGHVARIKKLLRDDDVLLLGNGAGLSRGTQQTMQELCELPHAKVIDADALKAISTKHLQKAILTPHSKELQILLSNNRTTVEAIVSSGNVLVLKGRIDSIFTPTGTFHNQTGNSRMAVGGTGDVLAGLCAGLLAQYRDLTEAAKGATFINGIIGDRLLEKKGFSFTAQDMLDEIGPVMLAMKLHKVVA